MTLAPILKDFDDDDIYPVYRFGCANTRDKEVCALLSPHVTDEHIKGAENVRQAYRQALSFVQLSGPTTLEPAI